jgi:S-adenosylmethionine:tRNA ribosyltransferase-isomerase
MPTPKDTSPLADSTPVDVSVDISSDLVLASYHYHLPTERIAQNPAIPRDSSRLLVVDATQQPQHHVFRELPDLLKSGDLLVLNNTRVIPARLHGRKVGGSKIEILLLEEKSADTWLALVKPGRRLKVGARIEFGVGAEEPESASDPESESESIAESIAESQTSKSEPTTGLPRLTAEIIAVDEATSGRLIRFDLPADQSLLSLLPQYGEVPLPPYIDQSQALPEQYQTVYSQREGSAAAPTAGLHFTPELLAELSEKGIDHCFVTLHVGVGTFRPVESENITEHTMHSEWVEISADTTARIQQTKAKGGRVIAVGTTVTRSLEGAAQSGELQPIQDKINLFIYPGYDWKVIDGLITNFHLPKSSLLMLVSAMVGRERLMALYELAIAENYRFYSFGDAMLILQKE